MGLQLGDTAPDFVVQTTEGVLRFHEWIGDSWAVLFSHPKDFIPVCTTELGSVAKLSPEFQRRNVKLIGLSVDCVEDHYPWLDDIEESQGARPDYPIIADTDQLCAVARHDHQGFAYRSSVIAAGPRNARGQRWPLACPASGVACGPARCSRSWW